VILFLVKFDKMIENSFKGLVLSSENISYICDICKSNFDEEEYTLTNDAKKCILHCEKNDWYATEYNLKNWIKSENKIKYFWKKVRNLIDQVSDKEKEIIDFKNTIFPQFEYIDYNSKTKTFYCELEKEAFIL
jgi:hypothetical protein